MIGVRFCIEHSSGLEDSIKVIDGVAWTPKTTDPYSRRSCAYIEFICDFILIAFIKTHKKAANNIRDA